MKIKIFTFAITLSTLALTLSAQAHDPKEHMKDAEAPKCAVMKDMDHSKMDLEDPIMQAMMKQCMKEMHHDGTGEEESNDDHKKKSNDDSSEHQH